MVVVTDLSGFWAGTIVQGPKTADVFVNVDVKGEAITGTYEIPSAPGEYRTGAFTGTLSGESLSITLVQTDPRVQFDLRVIEENGEYMVFGYTVRSEGSPRFSTVTLYKFVPFYKLMAGAWIP